MGSRPPGVEAFLALEHAHLIQLQGVAPDFVRGRSIQHYRISCPTKFGFSCIFLLGFELTFFSSVRSESPEVFEPLFAWFCLVGLASVRSMPIRTQAVASSPFFTLTLAPHPLPPFFLSYLRVAFESCWMKSSFSVSHVHAARYSPARLVSPLSMCAFISAYDETGMVLLHASPKAGAVYQPLGNIVTARP